MVVLLLMVLLLLLLLLLPLLCIELLLTLLGGGCCCCCAVGDGDGSYFRGRPRDKCRRFTNSLSSTIQNEPKSSSYLTKHLCSDRFVRIAFCSCVFFFFLVFRWGFAKLTRRICVERTQLWNMYKENRFFVFVYFFLKRKLVSDFADWEFFWKEGLWGGSRLTTFSTKALKLRSNARHLWSNGETK